MNYEEIVKQFKSKVCEQLRVVEEGENRFRVFTPFIFEDGDHLGIVLKKDRSGSWALSDEGNIYMRLTYDLDEKDLRSGTRQKVISNALSTFSVEDRDGELVAPIKENRYGDALYDFVQASLRIADVTYLNRERVKSTFMEDFRSFLEANINPKRLHFDWSDRQHDPEGLYSVDCKIDTSSEAPFFVYALPSDDKVKDSTIALLQFEKWGIPHRGVGVFESQEDINRKSLARFSDVCDKQFSNLATNKDRLARYLGSESLVQ
ncbi:MAG: DUF1828 domain-containing protein [Acidobacteria bacterium]|nr:DUF1828 domain-containing protein [Acidobacteriota bacterium]